MRYSARLYEDEEIITKEEPDAATIAALGRWVARISARCDEVGEIGSRWKNTRETRCEMTNLQTVEKRAEDLIVAGKAENFQAAVSQVFAADPALFAAYKVEASSTRERTPEEVVQISKLAARRVPGMGKTEAMEKLEVIARKLLNDGLAATFTAGMEAAIKQEPALYAEHARQVLTGVMVGEGGITD